MRKSLREDFNRIKASLQEAEGEILGKLQELELSQEPKRREGVNPEVLSRVRQESHAYSERIRDIEARKAQVREKYRLKK
jgi:hypothetical protein